MWTTIYLSKLLSKHVYFDEIRKVIVISEWRGVNIGLFFNARL